MVVIGGVGAVGVVVVKAIVAIVHPLPLPVLLLLAMLTASYVLLAVSTAFHSLTGFAIALLGSMLAGAAQSIGEVTNLAFLKQFPPELLGAWGAGTGLSGLAGPGLYMLLTYLQIPNLVTFLALVPTSVAYLLHDMLQYTFLDTILDHMLAELMSKVESSVAVRLMMCGIRIESLLNLCLAC